MPKMEPSITGSIYARSFIKFPHLVPIGQQTWPPRAILVSDWLIFQKNSPLKLNVYLVKWNQTWQKASMGGHLQSFLIVSLSDHIIWLPQIILVSDWLIFKKSSPLKIPFQMEPNMTGSIYGRSFTKFPHFVSIG